LKDLLLNSAYHLGVASLLRHRKPGQLTVLSIHRISDERNAFWNPIRPAAFDRLLGYVKKNYHVTDFNGLENGNDQRNGKPLLILSFDDGYHDFYEHALPLLQKHGLVCNHNIVNDCANSGTVIWTHRLNLVFEHCSTNSVPLNIRLPSELMTLSDHGNNWMSFYLAAFRQMLNLPKNVRNNLLRALEQEHSIESECRMMNWGQIRECAANGVQIGSHTYSHDSLSTIGERSILEHEILASKTEMGKELGASVNVFALPNGQTGQLADEVIAGSGFGFVLYANDDLNPLPLPAGGSTPVKISRINLVDEPFPQIALRTEQFHTRLRAYV
jgi:peptidoglycan/xylan/chitin deacetylase (PgdA/CDA1 family)